MKNTSFTIIVFAVLVLILQISAIRCTNGYSKSTNQEFDTFPQLLDRSEKTQLGLEWDNTKNLYGQLRAEIINNDDNDSRLKLAQLFTIEARVTGEHGHYYPAALATINDILTSKGLSNDVLFRALVTKAGVKLSLHEFAEAKQIAEAALAINNKNAQVYGVLVDAHVELGNYETAVQMADKMVAIKPDLRSYSRVSYLREIHGDMPGAIEAMRMAVTAGLSGTEETAWAALTVGEMYLKVGESDKAKMIFEEILTMRDNYPFAKGALGDLYISQNELSKAEATINEAINIIPEVGFYISLAKIYKRQNRLSELSHIKTEILAMLKDDVDNGHNMNLEYANIYISPYTDLDKALDYANAEYEKRPKNIDVNKLLSEIYLAKDDKTNAQFHLNKAMTTGKLYPDMIADM